MTLAFSRVRRDLSDLNLTATDKALYLTVSLDRDSERGGVRFAGLDHLARECGASTKTASRTLHRLTALGLIEHDLRQGKRTPFRIRLGRRAICGPTSDTTSDANAPLGVRSDFGHGAVSEVVSLLSQPGAAEHSTSDASRARDETETKRQEHSHSPSAPTLSARPRGADRLDEGVEGALRRAVETFPDHADGHTLAVWRRLFGHLTAREIEFAVTRVLDRIDDLEGSPVAYLSAVLKDISDGYTPVPGVPSRWVPPSLDHGDESEIRQDLVDALTDPAQRASAIQLTRVCADAGATASDLARDFRLPGNLVHDLLREAVALT